jgi:glutathionylspermidine synthase
MIREQFGPMLAMNTTRWLEAPWKMLLSNKAILPILYQLFPKSPYLLPAAFEPLDGPHVRKPLLSREGANIIIYAPGHEATETEGPYTGPYVYQRYHPLADFKGNHPVIGSWMINGYAAGIGIREDVSPVTGNFSRFVPHIFSNS